MRLPDERSEDEMAEELPLLTESAVVTDVSAMDRNRTDEVVAELRETLETHGSPAWRRERPVGTEACEAWLRERLDEADHVDGDLPLVGYLDDERREGTVGEKLVALQARYLQPYPSLLRVTVETEDPVEFAAGQYLSVRYDDTTRVYSVASSPTREALEFCIRRVPGGELTDDLAARLSAGDRLTLRGPYGDLLLEEPSSRDLAFLATGTGVAPFKSMIDYCFDTGRDRHEDAERDVWLFLGAAWADGLPYHDVFRTYADERENFHFVPTVSREPYLTDWNGETAYVQHTLAKYLADDAVATRSLPEAFRRAREEPRLVSTDARLDPSRMEVYACGLTAMVESLVAAAGELGVPEEHTHFEGFG
jgi:CDP-4-dehydro-6-deoxyglucose reductase